MTRFFFILSLCLACCSCNGIIEELESLEVDDYSVNSCSSARSKAKKKVQNGIIEHVIYGKSRVTDWEKEFNFNRYLKQNYNINVRYLGYISDEVTICYTQFMDSVIQSKHGKRFIRKCRAIANRNFYKGNLVPLDSSTYLEDYTTISQKGSKHESQYSFKEDGEFMGGEAVLHKMVAENFRMPEMATELEISGIVIIQFVIEKDGTLSQVISTSPKVRQLGYGIEEECIRVLKSTDYMWIPAQKNGKPVRSHFRFPFQIDNDSGL